MSRDTAYLPSFFLLLLPLPPSTLQFFLRDILRERERVVENPRDKSLRPGKGSNEKGTFVEKQESNCQIKGFTLRILNDPSLSKDQASISPRTISPSFHLLSLSLSNEIYTLSLP